MATQQLVRGLYELLASGGGKVQVWPNAAKGVAVTSGNKVFGSWTQIVAASVIPDPTYLIGVIPSDATAPTANEEYRIDLAIGASGSEISLSSGSATAQGLTGFSLGYSSAVGINALGLLPLLQPIKLNGAPRISAAVSEFLVGSTGVSIAIVTFTPAVNV